MSFQVNGVLKRLILNFCPNWDTLNLCCDFDAAGLKGWCKIQDNQSGYFLFYIRYIYDSVDLVTI